MTEFIYILISITFTVIIYQVFILRNHKKNYIKPEVYNLLRILFDETYQFIGLLSTDGILLDANASALRFSGISNDAVIGKHFADTPWWIHSKEEQEKLLNAIFHASNGEFMRFETTHIDKNNELQYIDFSLKPIFNDKHEVIYLIPEGRNITEFKKTETALKESEQTFRDLFEHSPDPALIFQDNIFIDCNNATVKDLYYSDKKDILFQHPVKISPEYQPDGRKSAEKANEMINIAFRDGINRFEWIHKKATGEEFPVEVTLSVMSLKGKKVLYCVWRDITQRKIYEKALEEAKNNAETATKTKNLFLANMSHELRTPLNGIIGLIEILKYTHPSEQQKEFIDDLEICSNGLLVLINDILDISRIEAGKIEEKYSEENFYLFIETVSKIFINDFKKKNIYFEYNIDPEIPEYIITDWDKLRQILNNLIGNAKKFTEKGFVRIDVEKKSETSESILLNFEVEDSGIGIPDSAKDKIFMPFEQADNSYSRKHQGAGLGLSITKKLVEFLGGTIYFESKENYGTKFTFTLNVKKTSGTQEVQEEEVTKSVNENKIFKILVVDDNEINQKNISFILKKNNYEVITAMNGFQAVEINNKMHPDLILMDLQMPEMNGIDATYKIREIHKKVPIIALTAYARNEDRESCVKAGMNDFISKPAKSETILSSIRKFLNYSDNA